MKKLAPQITTHSCSSPLGHSGSRLKRGGCGSTTAARQAPVLWCPLRRFSRCSRPAAARSGCRDQTTRSKKDFAPMSGGCFTEDADGEVFCADPDSSLEERLHHNSKIACITRQWLMIAWLDRRCHCSTGRDPANGADTTLICKLYLGRAAHHGAASETCTVAILVQDSTDGGLGLCLRRYSNVAATQAPVLWCPSDVSPAPDAQRQPEADVAVTTISSLSRT